MIDTYSANSLKILDRSPEEFKNKYIDNLSIFRNDSRAILGQKFHSLICAYIKGFDVSKFEKSLNDYEYKNWIFLKEKLKDKRKNFIKTEYPFLVKNVMKNRFYYLTGRFDAVYKENDTVTIYDWKTLNIPEDSSCDLQTIVYLFCAGEIYNTKKIKMKYVSIEKQISEEILYSNRDFYKKRIEDVILKI